MELRNKHDLEVMAEQIKTIVTAAEELKRTSGGVPAIDKNADAILAFAHILESAVPPQFGRPSTKAGSARGN